ncbi:hypothetical protein M422DRAFT_50891 [Sphaerobolus stellatus SS14]|uniref:Malic enzyme n=1 Tax=Sphaerobolus stellatus (strain SS14) TaxID=990650 RepID=A0A0C9V4Z9_SPHS4|nr:hypothetical protein M422DRAFT_193412 [Sphaerobolus stellatus SS14]KIJ36752.1 hypothetical protein M422DRAFT_50891 [Sphaerobolus stellatus SS14]
MPTAVLLPYWVDGIQKLKLAHQGPEPPAPGYLPPALRKDRESHVRRCLEQLRSKEKNIEKYIFLSQLKHADEPMFYRLCLDHMSEITPLIYTPTVGDACLQFSHIYRQAEGLFISYEDKGNIGSILRSWSRKDDARISVVTDGSRILGLGDLGINGMPISIGKLSLYIAGAGIRPHSTIPICLDLGTNNQKNLDDLLYLGLRRTRVSNEEMTEFMDEFMTEMSRVFPKLLVQFEDFSTEHAFTYLERYRHQYPVFNDDIQGTGCVVLSGFLNAARLSSAASGRALSDQRILFLGAGSATVGVATQLMSFFTLQGLSVEEARSRIWMADSQGLVYDARGPMAEHKKAFSRKDYSGPPIKNLVDIIKYVMPTALLGLSTTRGAFNQEVIETMATLNDRPIIFSLSNPVSLSECTFEEALQWSRGSVIFAGGSPFPDVGYGGVTRHAGQGNNMYVFPGLGLGAILSKASTVTDSMVETASLALADSLTAEEKAEDRVYPVLTRIRDISAQIAAKVIRTAQQERVDQNVALRDINDSELLKFVEENMWQP